MSYFTTQTSSHLVSAGLLATMTLGGIATSPEYEKFVQIENSRAQSNSIFLNPTDVLRSTIIDYFEIKSKYGWDGYDAIPITKISKEIALRIISSLPINIQNPDVIPSAAGGYSIEWFAKHKVLSIEIENMEISWSFVDAVNKRKQNGYEKKFRGKLDNSILELLIKEFIA